MKNKRAFALILSLGFMGIVMGALALITLQGRPDDAGLALPTLAQLPTEISVALAEPVTQTPLPVTGNSATEAPTDSAVTAVSTEITAEPAAPIGAVATLAGTDLTENAAAPEQLVIQFEQGSSAAERRRFIAQIGGANAEVIDGLDSVIVHFPAGNAPESLPESDLILHSEPNYYVTALQAPVNDPLYEQQWALPVIGVMEPLPVVGGEGPVVVAVIDSGICAHVDLAGRVLAGYDFVDKDDDPTDTFGHGCGVAGVIAANTDNGVGMAGAAPNTQILPLRVLDERGLGTYANVAQAMVYAVDHGADIINVSLGGTADSQLLRHAVEYAVSRGVMIIAAAGNSGQAGALYPAAYSDVVAVGAVDEALKPARFSNYGAAIDVWGPGSNILSLAATADYALFNGTSFAAPYVSAVAAIELQLGRTLVLHGQLVGVGGRVYETPSQEPPALPVSDVHTPEGALSLFLETDAQGALGMEEGLGVLRTRYAEINFSALSQNLEAGAQGVTGDSVLLNLFDDMNVAADFREVAAHSLVTDGFVWQGEIADGLTGEAVITVGEGQVSGRIVADGRTFRIRYAGNGVHAVHEVDASAYGLPHDPPAVPVDEDALITEYAPDASANNVAVIDLMIVYSPRARAALSTMGILNDIQLATTLTNRIFRNSGVNAQFNLVHVQEIAMVEQATLTQDLYEITERTGSWGQNVRMMRDNFYGADLVTLITDTNPYASCGLGWVMNRPGASNNAAYGFNVVEAECLWNGLTLAHEIGHNMGLAHDRANSNVAGAYPYAYGYADPQRRFTTVMTYGNSVNCLADRGCISLGRFSSASQRIGDLPLGNVNTDSVRALNNTAPLVANFRNSVTAVIPTATPVPNTVDLPETPSPNTAILTCNFMVQSIAQLRTAINTANTSGSMQNICLMNGEYSVTDAPYTLGGNNGRNAFPIITGRMRIIGNGASIERQGNTLFRFFQLSNAAELALVDLTLKNGYLPDNQHGGAINANNGVIALDGVTLANNTADRGGAIANGVSVEINHSDFIGNLANDGAAIYTEAPLSIAHVNFVDNHSSINIGAAISHRGASGSMIYSCLTGNSPVAVMSTGGFLQAGSNWWGSANGPSVLANDVITHDYGDVVRGNITYTNFYNTPLRTCTTQRGSVILESPAANVILGDAQPLFSWQGTGVGTLYDIELAQDASFFTVAQRFANLSESSVMFQTPLNDGIWYWRVRSTVDGRPGPWSAARRLVIDLTPPVIPAPRAPADGLSTTNTRPTFTWLRASDAVLYEIQLDTVNPPVVTYSSTVVSFRPTVGMLISPYYWRVRARDAAGNWSDWSATHQITIDSPANAVPMRNYYTVDTPRLTWSRMPWAIVYEVEVSSVANFRTVNFRQSVDRHTLEATTDPLGSGIYYWRVRAQMANGRWGAWSLADSFTVDAQ